MASSASGFAALTVAAVGAFGDVLAHLLLRDLLGDVARGLGAPATAGRTQFAVLAGGEQETADPVATLDRGPGDGSRQVGLRYQGGS